jgi:hypothetical protein
MRLRTLLTASLAGLVLSCSTSITKPELFPSRIDVSGTVQTVEYTMRGLGMEKPFRVVLKTKNGEETLLGYGHVNYQRFKKAYHKDVGVQCSPNPFDTTCRVYAFKVD